MSEKKKNKTICHFDEDDENFLLVIIQHYSWNKKKKSSPGLSVFREANKGANARRHFLFCFKKNCGCLIYTNKVFYLLKTRVWSKTFPRRVMKLCFLFVPQCFSSSPPAFSHCDTRILLFPTKDAARVFWIPTVFFGIQKPLKKRPPIITVSP